MRDMRAIEWKRPGEIRESSARKRFGLEQGGYRYPLRAVFQLAPAQLETLVRLDVRPQRHAQPFGACRHLREVALHDVVVEQQGRGFDVDHAGLRTSTRALLPMGTVRNTAYCQGLTEYVSQTSRMSPASRVAYSNDARQNSWTCPGT